MTNSIRPDRETAQCIDAWLTTKDECAAQKLIERLDSYVRGAVLGVVQGELAEDIIQDSFMQIFRKLHTFKGNSKLESWAYRVARNQALMHLRSTSRRPPMVTLKTDPRVTDDLMDIIEARAELRRVADVFDSLVNETESFRLYVFESKSIDEVALELGISRPAAKSRIFRARREIQELLAGC